MRRGFVALVAAAAVALPAATYAAVLWDLGITPTSAMQGQPTTFSVTATNRDVAAQLGCIQVDVASSFAIVSVGTPVATNGGAWASSVSGNSVLAKAVTGDGRLLADESVSFTIRARPTAAGTFAWPNNAYASQICQGTKLPGDPVNITVQPAPTPQPTSPPTPPPTPAQTPTPNTPLPSTPGPGSTPRPDQTPPTSATPSPTGETPQPGESSTPAPSATADPSVAPEPTAPSSGGRTATLRVAPLGGSADAAAVDVGVSLDVLALLDGPFVWFVPSAAVGVPGLLIIVFVGLQAVGAVAWIPAVRRLRGDDRGRPSPY